MTLATLGRLEPVELRPAGAGDRRERETGAVLSGTNARSGGSVWPPSKATTSRPVRSNWFSTRTQAGGRDVLAEDVRPKRTHGTTPRLRHVGRQSFQCPAPGGRPRFRWTGDED